MVAEVLAIIPARGGSKGIPRKNIRSFAGHPLIAYSIAAAKQSQTVTRVIVSTDDEEIAAVARQYGADTPFLRPAELAEDTTLDLPVFQHALNWLAEHENYHPDLVIQLRPTSPVRPVGLVDEAVRLLQVHPEADSVRGVVPAGQNPHKMWKIDSKTGRMLNLLKVPGIDEPYNAPRQALPSVYWQTGHIDVIRPEVILGGSMSGKVILPVQIELRYTVDIDGLFDWLRAEWLVKFGELDMVQPQALPFEGGKPNRKLPNPIRLVVFDFDGVLTDNRVWVDEQGHEMVAANRSDSMGLKYLREAGVEVMVLSTETNPVVAARCKKLRLPVLQAVEDKALTLKQVLAERSIDPQSVVFMGNDTNDTPCFPLVGCAVVPADAQTVPLREADIVLTRNGGHGAVRELCDMILKQLKD